MASVRSDQECPVVLTRGLSGTSCALTNLATNEKLSKEGQWSLEWTPTGWARLTCSSEQCPAVFAKDWLPRRVAIKLKDGQLLAIWKDSKEKIIPQEQIVQWEVAYAMFPLTERAELTVAKPGTISIKVYKTSWHLGGARLFLQVRDMQDILSKKSQEIR